MQGNYKALISLKQSKLKNNILSQWKFYTQKFKSLHYKYDNYITKKASRDLTSVFDKWRETAYWNHFDREFLTPFSLKNLQSTKLKYFNALKKNVEMIKLEAQKHEDAWLYYVRTRLSQVLSALG